MIRSHRIRIYPNKSQEEILNKSCGTARFVYNWGLNYWQEEYKKGNKLTYFKIKKHFNSIKEEQFPWAYQVTKCCVESGLTNLQSAFTKFFKKQNKYPRFHSKRDKNSFTIANDKFYTQGFYAKLPKIKHKVKLSEELRFQGKVVTGTVSKKANKWFISISVEIPDAIKNNSEKQTIGIDLGINTAVTTSDGFKFEAPKPLKIYQKKLRIQSKSLSRKKKGSSNWKKQVVKLQQVHYKIGNVRNDWLHKLTTFLTQEYGTIYMEDLNVKGMMGNHKLAKSLSDISFSELKLQLSYKGTVESVGRFFPSTKTCFQCGNKKDISLSERTYKCDICGYENDRDINAALNISREGYSRHQVCGHESSGLSAMVSETIMVEAGIKPCLLLNTN